LASGHNPPIRAAELIEDELWGSSNILTRACEPHTLVWYTIAFLILQANVVGTLGVSPRALDTDR